MAESESKPKTGLQTSPDESGFGDGSSSSTKNDEPTETEMIVPPDGGWGWVIVAASFFCNLLVDGLVYSCGNLLPPIGETFKEPEAKIAFVGSFLSGFYLLAGPFVSALANRYGFRKVTIAGTLLAAASFSLSYFATSIAYLYISFGIVGGIGLSMIYIPAVITVGFYFERWRALATGISMCGSGVGTILFGPLTKWLLKSYDWRGTILILAAMMLNCIICGSMFRPIKPTRVSVPKSPTDEELAQEKKSELEKRTLLLTSPPKSNSGFMFPIEMQNKVTPHTWMGVAPNPTYPTAAEIFKKSLTDLAQRRSSATSTGIKSHVNGTVKPSVLISSQVIEKDENLDDSNENSRNENLTPLLKETVKAIINEDSSNGNGRRHTVTGRYPKEHNRSRRGTLTGETQVSRPMYREDIFFGGSLKKIPQYQSHTSIGYHMSVTHLPTMEDVAEEENASCKMCPEAVKRTLVTMLDFSLLTSPSFNLLAWSGFFSMMGFFTPIIYIAKRAISAGMLEDEAVYLLSVIGFANTIGRVLCGVLSSLEGVNALWINNLAITIGGIATMLSGMSAVSSFQFTYCVIFGLSIACFASLRSIIVVELMGLEKLTNAFGLLMMFQGVAAIIGPPISGLFMDLTKSYDVSFYIAGGLYAFSGVLCYPLSYVSRWEKKRNAEKNPENKSRVV